MIVLSLFLLPGSPTGPPTARPPAGGLPGRPTALPGLWASGLSAGWLASRLSGWISAGFRLWLGFGWLRLASGLIWLSFTRILIGFGLEFALISVGFRLDSAWISA